MKTNRFKTLWGAALGLVLLAAIPFAASAQAEAKHAQTNAPSAQKAEAKEAAEPNRANPAWGFPGFGNPFMRPVPDDGPTDGKDHPNYHVTIPVESRLFSSVNHRAVVDLSARIDKQAGFRLDGTALRYQNYGIDPEKPSAPLLFGGKFAEDVSVNEKVKWPDLLQSFKYTAPITGHGSYSSSTPFNLSFDTSIQFMPGGCEITLAEYDESLVVIATNHKAEPARFKFTLRNGDESTDRKEKEKKDSQKGGFGGTGDSRPATPVPAATGSTDGTAHPDTPLIAPLAIKAFKPEQKVVIKGTVDLQCGFQIRGNTLAYLNSSATSSNGFSGSLKLTFGGKYASGVTVNGEAWTSLNRPLTLNTTLKKDSVKHVTFKGPSCSFSYRKFGDAVLIFVGNYDKNRYQDKPSQFEIVLYFADPADSTEALRTE